MDPHKGRCVAGVVAWTGPLTTSASTKLGEIYLPHKPHKRATLDALNAHLYRGIYSYKD